MAQIEMILQNTYDQQLNNFSDMIKHFYLSSGFNFLGTMEQGRAISTILLACRNMPLVRIHRESGD